MHAAHTHPTRCHVMSCYLYIYPHAVGAMIVTKVNPMTKNKLINTTVRNSDPAAFEFVSQSCKAAYEKKNIVFIGTKIKR